VTSSVPQIMDLVIGPNGFYQESSFRVFLFFFLPLAFQLFPFIALLHWVNNVVQPG
jgi:hypothetical protein